MAKVAIDRASRMEAILDRAEPRLRRAVLAAFAAAKDATTLAELESLVLSGDVEAAVTRAVELGSVKLTDEAAAVMVLSGQGQAEFLDDVLDVTVGFDQVNEGAIAALQQNRLRLIQGLTLEQRETVREALFEGIERGINPRETARLIRQSIGLTPRQLRAVGNYRRLLDSLDGEALQRELRDRRFDRTVRRAIRSGDRLTSKQVDTMVDRYRERYLKYRSEVIGRTEALRSAHQGSEEALRQATEAGHIAAGDLEREWVTARDKRVRDSHRDLNGMIRGVGETFPGDNGDLRYPGDPNAPGSETIQCRCVLATRIRIED
jgi:hypothetical protein